MRLWLVLLLCVSACAGRATVDGTEKGGVATWWNQPDPAPAMKAATEHCARYNRIAKPTQVEWTGMLTFSCE